MHICWDDLILMRINPNLFQVNFILELAEFLKNDLSY
jgi:hypothetical protein